MSAFLFIFNYLCIGVCIFIRWFWGGDLQNEFRESLITTQLIPHLKKKKSIPKNKTTTENNKCCWECREIKKSCVLFMGLWKGATAEENSMEVPQKIRHKITIWPDFPGQPAVKTLCFHCRGGMGSIPGWGSSRYRMAQPKKEKNLLPYDPAILLLGRHPMNWKKGHKEWKGQSLCSTL